MKYEDYLAYIFYRSEEESKGSIIWTRWNCLDDKIKDHYRKIASEEFEKWKSGELKAEAIRSKLLY